MSEKEKTSDVRVLIHEWIDKAFYTIIVFLAFNMWADLDKMNDSMSDLRIEVRALNIQNEDLARRVEKIEKQIDILRDENKY